MEIKYLPTGNIFDLPVEECKRIYSESPFNYEILDDKFEIKEEPKKGTVADLVMGKQEEKTEDLENEEKTEEMQNDDAEKSEDEIKAELIKRCEELGINSKQLKRCGIDTLRAKIKQKEAELQE